MAEVSKSMDDMMGASWCRVWVVRERNSGEGDMMECTKCLSWTRFSPARENESS